MSRKRAIYIALAVYVFFIAMLGTVLIAWRMQTSPSENVRVPRDLTLEKTGSGGTAEQIANTTGAQSSPKKEVPMK